MVNSGNRRPLAYILGPSYCGSTLLTFLLAQHKDIATIGELKGQSRGDLNKYFCSCGALQRECSFWKQVVEEMQTMDAAFSLEDFGAHFGSHSYLSNGLLRARVRGRLFEGARTLLLRCWPDGRRGVDAVVRRNQQMIDVICRLQNASVFLDGSKEAVRLKLLALANRWIIRVIYLIRDGRGVTNSSMRHNNFSMAAAAHEWHATHQECDRVTQALGPDASIIVHYEDLSVRPGEVLRRIFSFLGLGDGNVDLKYKSFAHHILGNKMRLDSTNEITLDEKWKTSLTREDLHVFDRIGGRLNQAYGYDRTPRR